MRATKLLATVAAAAAMIAVGVAGAPSKAEAYVVYTRVYAAPVVVVRPPVVYYAPRPVYVVPQHVWVPAHYDGPYFVPGHWA
jgi:hypothetical protein